MASNSILVRHSSARSSRGDGEISRSYKGAREFLRDSGKVGYCRHQKRWLSVFAAYDDCSAGDSSQRWLMSRRQAPVAHGIVRQILALCYPAADPIGSLIADFPPKKGYYLNLSLQKQCTYAPAHCLSN